VSAKQRLGTYLIPRLPITRYVFDIFRWEVNAAWVRLNASVNPRCIDRRKLLMQQTDLSMNVGCGPSGKPGWVNLDLMNMPNLTLRCDCRRHLPVSPGSTARIRCEHFLEHLDPLEEIPSFLASCREALREGGIMRIVVPDAGRYLKAYASGQSAQWTELGWNLRSLPEGFAVPMDVVNHVFRQGGEHRYAYDSAALESRLRAAGFTAVACSSFGNSVDPLLRDDLPHHEPYSLYVEAVK
jgi:predicted SAM-dependent methyltransferase